MPTIEIAGYRFQFTSLDRAEPPHMHVRKDGDVAKIWLSPAVRLVYNHGYSGREIRNILRLAEENRGRLLDAWDDFFR